MKWFFLFLFPVVAWSQQSQLSNPIQTPISVANGGTGTGTAFTANNVIFAGASGVYTQDAAFTYSAGDLGVGGSSGAGELQLYNTNRASVGNIREINSGNLLFDAGGVNGMLNLSGANGTAGFFVGTDNNEIANTQLDIRSNSKPTSFVLVVSSNDATTQMFSVTGQGRVGIGAVAPATSLDVNGNAQFGSGVTKSTFSTTGSLNLDNGASFQRNSVNVSTFATTVALSGTFANTAIGPCIANSSITVTIPAGAPGLIQLNLRGTISVATLAAVIGVGILLDGALTDGETASKGMIAPLEPVASDGTNVSFSTLLSGLSAAQHTVCLAPFVSAGTGTIDSTNSVMKMQMYALP